MRKKTVFLTVPVFLILSVAMLLVYIFVCSIHGVEILNGTADGSYTLVRYEKDIQEQIFAEVIADNPWASRELIYISDQPDIVEVSEMGIMTARNPGDAVITVKSKGNPWVKADFGIKVVQKALGMEIAMPEELPSNEYYYLLHLGDTPAMVPKPYPSNAYIENLFFESENPDIVSVTAEGRLNAHKAGIAIIHVSWTGPYTEPGQKEELGSFLINVCRRTDHENLADHEIQWYEESCLIAHALGNAGEYTSDGEVVCRHTWYSDTFGVSYDGDIPDLATFEKEKYFDLLTPLTGRMLLEMWAEHPELYFITDVKQDENTNLLEVLEKFVKLAREMGYEGLLDHLVIQVYTPEEYDKIKDIYPFQHFLFTTYQILDTPGGDVTAVAFAAEKDMGVLTVPASCMGTDYFIKLAEEYGLLLFTHTLNDGSDVCGFQKGAFMAIIRIL